MDKTIEPETIEDILKSMEGMLVKYGEPNDLIVRLAGAIDRELDELHQTIEDLRAELGL